jgi:hypothetical protein
MAWYWNKNISFTNGKEQNDQSLQQAVLGILGIHMCKIEARPLSPVQKLIQRIK